MVLNFLFNNFFAIPSQKIRLNYVLTPLCPVLSYRITPGNVSLVSSTEYELKFTEMPLGPGTRADTSSALKINSKR